MENYHIIRNNGLQEGPFSEEELKQFYANTALPQQTLVWMAGWAEWRACGEVFDWFPPPAPQDSLNKGICVSMGSGRNYLIAGLLAIFLGGSGIHKFYNGSWGWGIFYLLFFIPSIFITMGLWSIIPFIEGILYIVDEAKYNKKYNDSPAAPFKW